MSENVERAARVLTFQAERAVDAFVLTAEKVGRAAYLIGGSAEWVAKSADRIAAAAERVAARG